MNACFRKCKLARAKDTYQAASCVGRQPNTDVWVFGPNLQLSGDGSITNAEASSILWVQEVVDMEDGQSKRRSTECSGLPDIKLPLYGYALRDVIKAVINTVHDNTMAGIFTIGMLAVISFQGASLINIAHTFAHVRTLWDIHRFLGEFAYLTTYFLWV